MLILLIAVQQNFPMDKEGKQDSKKRNLSADPGPASHSPPPILRVVLLSLFSLPYIISL